MGKTQESEPLMAKSSTERKMLPSGLYDLSDPKTGEPKTINPVKTSVFLIIFLLVPLAIGVGVAYGIAAGDSKYYKARIAGTVSAVKSLTLKYKVI